MKSPGSRIRFFFIAFFFIIAIQITVYAPRFAQAPPPLSWIAQILLSTVHGVETIVNVTSETWKAYVANVSAQKELIDLQAQNQTLEFELLLAQQQLYRYQAWDEVLGWQQAPWDEILAEVVFHSPSERFHLAWVRMPNTKKNLDKHVAVTQKGLLGRIVRQYGRFAQILLVHDVESAVDVRTRSGVRAIVHGTGSQYGNIDFVPTYEPLQIGDVLYTSGADMVFPSGIPVGIVTEVQRPIDKIYLEAKIQFFELPSKVEWVRILPVDRLDEVVDP